MTDKHADQLRAAIERLEAPAAPHDLMSRVVAERARGVRRAIPGGAEASPPRIRPAFLAGIAATLIIGGVLVEQGPARNEPGTDFQLPGECRMNGEAPGFLTAGSLLLATACAQQPTDSPYEPAPPVEVLDSRGPTPGTWVYEIGRRHSTERRRHVYQLSRAGSADQQQWRSVSTIDFTDGSGHHVDTLVYAADGSTPVRHDIHIARHGPDLWVSRITYGPAGAQVVSDYLGYQGHPPHRRTWTSPLPAGEQAILPAVHGPAIVHLLRKLPLAAGWVGSVQAGPMGTTGFRSMSLRVAGEETVRVPAGVFDCWRVALTRQGSGQDVLWVSKGEQLLVKTLSGSGEQGVEGVLISFVPAE